VLHVAWVFDCDAPLDAFQRRMVRALERAGWMCGPAALHDFAASGGGARCFVKLLHHPWGVQVHAKVKPGLLGSGADAQRALWSAGREAQLASLGAAPRGPQA
jgi:hypothetical protein